MRLRPSGRQGPVATSLASFRSYHLSEAWTWEHLALTRARAVAGAPAVGAAAEAVRDEVLGAPRDRAKTLADVRDMRQRLTDADGRRSPWDAKRGPGRLQDIALLAQTSVLFAGKGPRRADRQLALGAASGWLPAARAEALAETHRWLWKLQAASRLLTGATMEFDALGEGGRGFVLGQTGARDGADLSEMLANRSARAAEHVGTALDAGFNP